MDQGVFTDVASGYGEEKPTQSKKKCAAWSRWRESWICYCFPPYLDVVTRQPQSLIYVLEQFKLERNDRACQLFKDRPLSVPLFTDSIVLQKTEYIHYNPVQYKWQLAASPETYVCSTAAFYGSADWHWPFRRIGHALCERE